MKLSDEILLHLRACKALARQARDLWEKAKKLEEKNGVGGFKQRTTEKASTSSKQVVQKRAQAKEKTIF